MSITFLFSQRSTVPGCFDFRRRKMTDLAGTYLHKSLKGVLQDGLTGLEFYSARTAECSGLDTDGQSIFKWRSVS